MASRQEIPCEFGTIVRAVTADPICESAFRLTAEAAEARRCRGFFSEETAADVRRRLDDIERHYLPLEGEHSFGGKLVFRSLSDGE